MFIINDIDVEEHVLALSKLIDKSTTSEVFLRQRGSITIPTKYQMEKISLTLGFNIADTSHKIAFSSLVTEIDEYPLVFVKSEKIKSLMFSFTDRDSSLTESSLQVFMLDRIALSISADLKNFVTININLIPYNAYSIIDDFSFITYEINEKGEHEIKSGIEDPRESRIFKDFFRKRVDDSFSRLSSFLMNNSTSDIAIMAPYFSQTKPEESLQADVFEIFYTDQSELNNPDGHDDFRSFQSYKTGPNNSDNIDKAKKSIYVYWKGDVFSSDPNSVNAVTSIEVIRNNNIVSQPISGHSKPIVQYLGKREGYLTIGFTSKADDGNITGSVLTPYSMFKALLEKHEYNMFSEPRFSAYNIFKIKSALTSVVDVNGYVPAQVFLQADSSDRLQNYKAVFAESFPIDLGNIMKGKIETQKDEKQASNLVNDVIKQTHDNFLNTGIVKPPLVNGTPKNIKAIIATGGKNSEYFNLPGDDKEDAFITGFYDKIIAAMEIIRDSSSLISGSESKILRDIADGKMTIGEFIKNIPDISSGNIGNVSEISKKGIADMLNVIAGFVSFYNDSKFLPNVLSPKLQDYEDINILGEFQNFRSEAAKDLRLADSFDVSLTTPYLGITDARKISCAPFLTWKPLITKDLIELEYSGIAANLDKQFDEVYGKGLRIVDAAKKVANGERGDPKYEDEGSTYQTALDAVRGPIAGPILGALEDLGVLPKLNLADLAKTIGKADNLIEWIGERDAGTNGFEALNTVFCMKTGHGLDLTKMTVAQIMAKQPEWSNWSRKNKDKCHFVSHATGKFQAMNVALTEALANGVIKSGDLFDEKTQNKFGFWAATIKSGRKSLANDFIEARNAWKAGKMTYAAYSAKRNVYHNSLACEWAAIEKTNGVGCHGGQGYVKPKDMIAAMDNLPLYSARLAADAPNVASKLAKPLELSGLADSAPPPADTSVTPKEEKPVEEKPKEEVTPSSKEDAFRKKYSGLIPSSGNSGLGTSSSGNSPISTTEGQIAKEGEAALSTVTSPLSALGTTTDYTVFDDDINVQIQARDGTTMFNHGFNLAFPVVKAYIVWGGSNDNINKYSYHSPNYIELDNILGCNVVLNDVENPVDVAYLELSNPGRVYTDAVSFWESFKPRIDFEKYGTSEELRFLVDQMMIAPGNRLHIRAGYGNDPNKLETIFNGEITVVDDTQSLSIVAEGYGRELLMARHGYEKSIILSSSFNSGTRESIADMLLRFEEVQNLGRRAGTVSDWIVQGFFRLATGNNLLEEGGTASVEPEGRRVFGGQGSDDTFSYARFGSNISRLDALRSQVLLKNIYAEEVTMVDAEFQWNLASILDLNRELKNFLVMYNHTICDVMKSIKYRQPNTHVKPMNYDNEMSLFFGIKDQCYIATNLNSKLQHGAVLGANRKLYEKMKYKRYKAVSQTHIVSSGVNLISNRMKVSSDFPTRVNVGISTQGIGDMFTDGMMLNDEIYWKDKDVLPISYDDNLRPNAIRDTDLNLMGSTSKIAAVRYGTSFMMESVKDMYDGEIVVIGNEKMKNGDIVFLTDTARGILGFVEISECQHAFSSRTGFVTSFRPKLFSEARSPYFTHLGKKIRVSFALAFSSAIEKISQNIDKSELFSYLNFTMDQIGVMSSPVEYKLLPYMTTIENILNRPGSDSTTGIIATGASVAFSKLLISRSVSSVGALISANKAAAISKAGESFSRMRGLYGNTKIWNATSALYSRVAGGQMGKTGANIVARVSTNGLIRTLAPGVRHPVALLVIGALVITTAGATSTLERWLLGREPTEITPVTMFGKPYIAGINGAKSEGVFLDSVSNMIETFKAFKKTFQVNRNIARVAGDEYQLSPFDKDYIEY